MAVEEHSNIRKKQRDTEEKPHEDKGREILHLPVITVDQLSFHRKKRSAVPLPHDNLKVPIGSFKSLKSEYTRRFKGFEDILPELKVFYAQKPYIPQPSLKLEGRHEYESEYEKSFGHELVTTADTAQRSTGIIQTNQVENVVHAALGYLIEKRQQLQRKKTTLRMLGEMEHETEFSRNFVAYQRDSYRPPLCKKFTNLHLSGSINLETENRENYQPFKVEKHVPLTKKPTNLHLEGTLFLEPEYKSAYIEYKNYEKQKPTLPTNHIKAPMVFSDFQESEHRFGSFTRSQLHPVIPFLREPYEPSSRSPSRPNSRTGSLPGSRNNSRPGSRSNSRPNSRTGSRAESRAYSPKRPSSRFSETGSRWRRGSADLVDSGPFRSVSRSPTMPNLRDKPTRLQPLSMSLREPPPKIKITNEDDRRVIRKDQRITYTKKLQPNLALGLPPLPLSGARESASSPRDSKPPSGSRGKWRSTPQNLNKITLPPQKDKDIDAFEGNFECQPEYRKAYHNYLMRERKTQSLDRTIVGKEQEKQEISESSDFLPSNGISSPRRLTPTSPNSKIKKNIEKMETLAFGPRCRRDSFSSHFSSSDGEIIAPKSKFKEEEKKRSPKFHYKHRMTIDVHPNMYNSDSEPSFVIVDKEF